MELSAEEVIPLDVRVCMNERTKGKMKPERGALESSSAGTGPKAHGQQRLSSGDELPATSDELLSTAVRSSTGVRIWGKALLPLKILSSG